MKIRTLVSVKHAGKLHPPGTTLDADTKIGAALVAAGHAEKALVEPAAEPEADPEPAAKIPALKSGAGK